MKQKNILIAVGSSGGHIYPALAIAKELESFFGKKFNGKKNHWNIYFIHSGSNLGKKIFSSVNYPVYEIPIGGMAQGQKFFQKLKTLLQIPKVIIQAFLLIKKIQAEVILGTGGAITGPVLMAGFLMGKKTAIWEGNAVMGLANKLLTPFVSCVFSVFPDIKGLHSKKYIVCPYPLRKSFQYNSKDDLSKEESFLEKKNFKTEKVVSDVNLKVNQEEELIEETLQVKKTYSNEKLFTVLILGGSQGSVLFNQVVSQAIEEKVWRKDIFIYHQTGERSFEGLRKKYKTLENVEPFAFSFKLEEYYKKCDLIFSRAGSGAIAEVASYQKPLVLIPLAHSAGAHQLQNTLFLFSKSAVEMISEKDFNVTTFKNKLIELKKNEEKRNQMGIKLKSFYKGDGAKQIANWIYDSFTK